MQQSDIIIAITAALEAFMERFTFGERPSEEVIRAALCAGLRALAERAAMPERETIEALNARIDQADKRTDDLIRILQGLQELIAAGEAARSAAHELAERDRDARAAAAEEARERRFEAMMIEQSAEFRLSMNLWGEELERGRQAPAPAPSRPKVPDLSPKSAVLDAVVELTRSGMSPDQVRRWLVRRCWTRKTHRSAALRELVNRLRACPEETLSPVVDLVLSEQVWSEMIGTLQEIEARRASRTAGEADDSAPVVDLVREGERRTARGRR